jgi:hypothetical protein
LPRLAVVGLVVLLAACTHKAATPPVEPAPQVAPVQSRVDTGLLGELGREAAQRPKTEPTVDTVLAAFEVAGVHIDRKQQVLATPVGARYCVAASSKVGLNMSLCEYATADDAKAGRDKSLQVFKTLKGRSLFVQNATLLTLIAPPTTAIAVERDLATKVFRSFTER